jgi:hypothetical protein
VNPVGDTAAYEATLAESNLINQGAEAFARTVMGFTYLYDTDVTDIRVTADFFHRQEWDLDGSDDHFAALSSTTITASGAGITGIDVVQRTATPFFDPDLGEGFGDSYEMGPADSFSELSGQQMTFNLQDLETLSLDPDSVINFSLIATNRVEVFTQSSEVPVPAAVWLLGTGLLGLVGLRKRLS